MKPFLKYKQVKVKVDNDSIDITVTLPWRPFALIGLELGLDISIELPVHPMPQPPPTLGPGDIYGGPPPGSKITLPGTSPPREVYI